MMSGSRWKRWSSVLACLVLAICTVASVDAGPIRVSQESAPNAGDFDANILGYASPFVFAGTPAQFYAYANASYNGSNPAAVNGLSQIFLVQTSAGLQLAMIHDSRNDGSGGAANTRWDLVNDTAAYTVRDDDPGNDDYPASGPNTFEAEQRWNPCCTDGYMIGSLDGFFIAYGQFTAAPAGIQSWQFTNSAGSPFSLSLAPGQRMRIDMVPEPGTWALMGLGLLGLGVLRRRMTKA